MSNAWGITNIWYGPCIGFMEILMNNWEKKKHREKFFFLRLVLFHKNIHNITIEKAFSGRISKNVDYIKTYKLFFLIFNC